MLHAKDSLSARRAADPVTVRSESTRLYERARRVLLGGVSRNTLLYCGPIHYARHGGGCLVIDADGIERIDFSNNVAANIHGHGCKPVIRAVREQLRHGTVLSMATEAEVQLAELLCDRARVFTGFASSIPESRP